jgi:alkylation response protein AidB-like acyl-CoA dehydrogenase
MNERVSIAGTPPPRGSGPIASATSIWAGLPAEARTKVRRDRLVQLWVEAEVQRLTRMRASAAAAKGTPGPEGSLGKLAGAESNKRIYDFCVDLQGAEGMLYDSYEMRRPSGANMAGIPTRTFLRSRANSIEGGTSEVMRNIIGERVLGLSGDIRADKAVPWSRVPRN